MSTSMLLALRNGRHEEDLLSSSIDCCVPVLEFGHVVVDKVSRDHPFLLPRRESLLEYQDCASVAGMS